MPRWDEFPEENEELARREYEEKNFEGEVTPRDDSPVRVFHTTELTLSPQTLTAELGGLRFRWLIGIPLAIVAGLVVHWLTLWITCAIAAVLAILSIGSAFASGMAVEHRRYLTWFSVIFGTFLTATLMPTRLIAASVTGAITCVIFIKYARRPIDFLHQWIFAGKGMDQEGLVHTTTKWTPAPSHFIFAAILLLMIVVPAVHSVTLAVLLIPLFCLGIIAVALGTHHGEVALAYSGLPVNALSKLRMVIKFALMLQLYFAGYPDSENNHHWNAAESQSQRRRTLALLWGSVTVTTAIALSYCIPYEFFGAWFQPGFIWTIPPLHHERPFEWLTLPLLMAVTAHIPYIGAIMVGVVFSIFLPRLILLAAYMPALLRAQDAAVEANILYREAVRIPDETHFERFCRQMWNSERAIEIPERLEL